MTGRREFIKRSAMGLTAGIAAVGIGFSAGSWRTNKRGMDIDIKDGGNTDLL
jgi:hypothetical protein